ncbi:serine hydrolase [Streptomyces gardneri]|uniref:serine hydrolase n=1 Tax=Streptomyces gardneri TaxID=66892 RepID=UPI003680D79F
MPPAPPTKARAATRAFTATALMRLVADGHVELDAPVRRYVPELRLADERTAAEITVLQLLHHTAGLDRRFGAETARVMPPQVMHRMQQRTVELRGTSPGDAMGIGWFLRDTDGVRVVEHGGSAGGRFAEPALVPERDFAVVVASNEDPDNGLALNRAVVRWAQRGFFTRDGSGVIVGADLGGRLFTRVAVTSSAENIRRTP